MTTITQAQATADLRSLLASYATDPDTATDQELEQVLDRMGTDFLDLAREAYAHSTPEIQTLSPVAALRQICEVQA